MRRRVIRKEFIVGIIGIIALLSIYLIINFFKGINLFKSGETYYAKFNNVSELVTSTSVFINGYKAGNVRSITYKSMNDIIVELDIDRNMQIPKGSIAVNSLRLLGGSDVYIKLSDSGTYYQPGDTMPGMLDKGMMGEAGEKIMPAINNILPKLDSILTATNNIMSSEALMASVKNIEILTEELKTSTKQLNNIMVNDIPQITGRVVEIEDDVLAVSSQLKEVDYESLFATLDSTLGNIHRISAALNESQGTLGLLLNDSALYNNLNSTCQEANKLLEDLREHPKRYVHFSVFGRKDK